MTGRHSAPRPALLERPGRRVTALLVAVLIGGGIPAAVGLAHAGGPPPAHETSGQP